MARKVKNSLNVFQRKEQLKDRLRRKHAIKQGDKTIVLNMIVRNESKIITRLLDSVKPIIDFICITDTGSTDNTEDIIYAWGKENNIPTTVCHEPFKNFSYNRTNSVKNAKRCYPEADYILLADADFTFDINVNGTFRKDLLIDHSYLISQYNNTMSYDNVRLISSKVDWKYYLRTHEYIAENTGSDRDKQCFDGYIRVSRIRTLRINDLEDGGHKDEKYERDLILINEDLADPEVSEDDKIRCRFYLARTLHDIQRYEEAIEAYLERCKHVGFIEEVYYSKFQIGHCYETIAHNILNCSKLIRGDKMIKEADGDIEILKQLEEKNIFPLTEEDVNFIKKWNSDNLEWGELVMKSEFTFEKADEEYWKAYQYRKSRAEALAALTRMHRELFHSQRAYNLAEIGKTIKPTIDTLFVYSEDYKEYTWDFEISVTACYLNKIGNRNGMDVGLEATQRVLEYEDEIPPGMLEVTRNNLQFYI